MGCKLLRSREGKQKLRSMPLFLSPGFSALEGEKTKKREKEYARTASGSQYVLEYDSHRRDVTKGFSPCTFVVH
jgi:hypothetical protein